MLVTVPRAYQTELDLKDRQITACKRHAGAARFAYNWGLARKQEAYKVTGKSQSAIDLVERAQEDRAALDVCVCSPRGDTQSGQRLCPLLPPLPAEAGRQAQGHARLPSA